MTAERRKGEQNYHFPYFSDGIRDAGTVCGRLTGQPFCAGGRRGGVDSVSNRGTSGCAHRRIKMPSKNSITRTVRLTKSDVRVIEEYMDRYGITFNNAVHTIISEKYRERQMDMSDYIDLSGERVDDHGERRSEFDCMRNMLPKKLGTVCRNCGSSEGVEYHHIKPLSHGGTNDLNNIVPLCGKCHSALHGKAQDSEKERLRAENEQLKRKIAALKSAIVAMSED